MRIVNSVGLSGKWEENRPWTRTGPESQAIAAKTIRVTGPHAADHNRSMEQSIRKVRPLFEAASMTLMLAVALVAAVAVNVLLLCTHF